MNLETVAKRSQGTKDVIKPILEGKYFLWVRKARPTVNTFTFDQLRDVLDNVSIETTFFTRVSGHALKDVVEDPAVKLESDLKMGSTRYQARIQDFLNGGGGEGQGGPLRGGGGGDRPCRRKITI